MQSCYHGSAVQRPSPTICQSGTWRKGLPRYPRRFMPLTYSQFLLVLRQYVITGDQAEIVFTLIGEPPFTFTYQRAEPISRKGGKAGKVLETHTVSGVSTHEYSIFSVIEGMCLLDLSSVIDLCDNIKGTWTVTSISDRHCRYPPAQQNDKIKRITN